MDQVRRKKDGIPNGRIPLSMAEAWMKMSLGSLKLESIKGIYPGAKVFGCWRNLSGNLVYSYGMSDALKKSM